MPLVQPFREDKGAAWWIEVQNVPPLEYAPDSPPSLSSVGVSEAGQGDLSNDPGDDVGITCELESATEPGGQSELEHADKPKRAASAIAMSSRERMLLEKAQSKRLLDKERKRRRREQRRRKKEMGKSKEPPPPPAEPTTSSSFFAGAAALLEEKGILSYARMGSGDQSGSSSTADEEMSIPSSAPEMKVVKAAGAANCKAGRNQTSDVLPLTSSLPEKTEKAKRIESGLYKQFVLEVKKTGAPPIWSECFRVSLRTTGHVLAAALIKPAIEQDWQTVLSLGVNAIDHWLEEEMKRSRAHASKVGEWQQPAMAGIGLGEYLLAFFEEYWARFLYVPLSPLATGEAEAEGGSLVEGKPCEERGREELAEGKGELYAAVTASPLERAARRVITAITPSHAFKHESSVEEDAVTSNGHEERGVYGGEGMPATAAADGDGAIEGPEPGFTLAVGERNTAGGESDEHGECAEDHSKEAAYLELMLRANESQWSSLFEQTTGAPLRERGPLRDELRRRSLDDPRRRGGRGGADPQRGSMTMTLQLLRKEAVSRGQRARAASSARDIGVLREVGSSAPQEREGLSLRRHSGELLRLSSSAGKLPFLHSPGSNVTEEGNSCEEGTGASSAVTGEAEEDEMGVGESAVEVEYIESGVPGWVWMSRSLPLTPEELAKQRQEESTLRRFLRRRLSLSSASLFPAIPGAVGLGGSVDGDAEAGGVGEEGAEGRGLEVDSFVAEQFELSDDISWMRVARVDMTESGMYMRSKDARLRAHEGILEGVWAQKREDIAALAPSALKRLVWRGVPDIRRPRVFRLLTGAEALLEEYPQLYKDTVERVFGTHIPSRFYQIPKFGGFLLPQDHFLSSEGSVSCGRILWALALEHPDIDYVPTLPDLVCMLLLFLPEDDAFVAAHLMVEESRKGRKYLNLTNGEATLFLKTFHSLLQRREGKVAATMARLKVPVTAIADLWFKRLFVGSLPYHTALRVLNCYLLEGSRMLYRVGLALVQLHRTALVNAHSAAELIHTLQQFCAQITDADVLLRKAAKVSLKHSDLRALDRQNRPLLAGTVQEPLFKPYYRPKLDGLPTKLMSDVLFEALWSMLPARNAIKNPTFLFGSHIHGYSLDTLLGKCAGHAPVILLIKDKTGHIFGVYASQGIRPHKKTEPASYGDTETFLFKLHPEVRQHRWRGGAEIFCIVSSRGMAFGDNQGLKLDADLLQGHSEACDTFEMDTPLSVAESFQAVAVEAYGVTV